MSHFGHFWALETPGGNPVDFPGASFWGPHCAHVRVWKLFVGPSATKNSSILGSIFEFFGSSFLLIVWRPLQEAVCRFVGATGSKMEGCWVFLLR